MLVVTSLTKGFATRGTPVVAIDDVSFTVNEGEFFSILGPSGCGKTTILRAVAGLEQADAGEIRIAGKTVYSAAGRVNVPPQRREVSLMFQSYAIWPHMSVYENVAFPLRARRAERIDQRVKEMLATVALVETAERPASRLSGGQQQRLALARAIVSNPRVLLLDEPLSNLDVKLREQLRLELKRIQKEYGVTTVYVTHDQAEALSLSDRLAVMDRARILQVGLPHEIYRNPATRTVAQFIGQSNILEATAVGPAEDGTVDRFATALGIVSVARRQTVASEGDLVLSVRPEDVRLVHAGQPVRNAFTGKVAASMFYGDHQDLQVDTGTIVILMRVPGNLTIKVGDEVHAYLDPEAIAVSLR
jgi:iron(III) transport system ATP-binding protein